MNAKQYRQHRRSKPDQTAEITLPSGFVATLRRPPLQLWVQAGKIPQSMLRRMMDSGAVTGADLPDLTTDEALAAMVFLRDAVVYAFVAPRIVPGADPEDETALDPSDLDPADFEFVAQWVMRGAPGVPVDTKGGQVTTDDLSRFRQRRPGGGFVDDRVDSTPVSSEAESVAAAV